MSKTSTILIQILRDYQRLSPSGQIEALALLSEGKIPSKHCMREISAWVNRVFDLSEDIDTAALFLRSQRVLDKCLNKLKIEAKRRSNS